MIRLNTDLIKDRQALNTLREFNIDLRGDAYICGGVFRSLINNDTIRDVDIFCSSNSTSILLKLIARLSAKYGEPAWIAVEDYVSIPIQTVEWDFKGLKFTLILPNEAVGDRCFYGNPEDILSHFDFTCTQYYMDMFSNVYMMNEDTLKATLEKKIVINRQPADEGELNRCLRRVDRYECNYGYNLVDEVIIKC